MSDGDRRDNIRVSVNEEFAAIDGLLTEYVANISRGGIFLRCEEVLPVGTEVTLRFTVLADDLETIEGRGEVMHHGTDTPGLGISFLELTEDSQRVVETVCRRMEIALRR